MGKQKKSKRKYSSSESSSRKNQSSRSQSSQSYRNRSKKHKHKQDKKRKHQSRKDERRHYKQQQRQDRKQKNRQNQRHSLRQKIPKRQQTIQDMRQKYHQSLKQEKIQAQKIELKRQQQRINQGQYYDGNQISPQQLLQQQDKPKKQQPNFQPSGILLQYYNARQGVSLRFHQPPQARQPQQQWRMYIFKGEQVLNPIQLTKSSYLIGKDDRVVDILAQNPSISRQHCVIQFRLIQKRQTQGDYSQTIKPYIMDLQSTNGTFLNDQRIQSGRYYELLHRDVLKFGFSNRQYVIVKWDVNNQDPQQLDQNN